jgi:homoserine/homoserine lactone efflux protein
VANSVAHGVRYGFVTVAGTASAMVLQLALVVLGASTALAILAGVFDWLRWAGVAYLVWLGARTRRAPPVDLAHTEAELRSAAAIFARGFLVSLTNPKTLLCYGAFLPQFVTTGGGETTRQLLALAATFLAIAVLLDGAWAVLAGRLRRLLATHARLRNPLTGGLLMGAGLGLALARRP